jgi:hypothetical protein
MSVRAGRLPLDGQVRHFRRLLYRNPTLVTVLDRAAAMDLPGWYLVAGWPELTVLPWPGAPTAGLR